MKMERRTVTMNWDEFNGDDDDEFFESTNRLSVVVPLDMPLPEFDDDDDDIQFNDTRVSFSHKKPQNQYEMWMVAPGSITDRRRRLLQGMGLNSNKDFATTTKFNNPNSKTLVSSTPAKSANIDSPPVQQESTDVGLQSHHAQTKSEPEQLPEPKPQPQQQSQVQHNVQVETNSSQSILLARCRSDSDIQTCSFNIKRRKEDMIGSVSKQRLTRTSSELVTPSVGLSCHYASVHTPKIIKLPPSMITNNTQQLDSFFLIKNLDTGKEFVVKEFNDEGTWNKVSDLQTGKQLTMDEFESSVGHSPVVKELMRRTSRKRNDGKLAMTNSYLSKSFRNSKKKGAAILKNLKLSMSISKSEKQKDPESTTTRTAPSFTTDTCSSSSSQTSGQHKTKVEQTDKNLNSEWVKARAYGKPSKEFSALHLCQKIQAHDGSIWTMRFSFEGQYLASGGEDKVIHVWEVQECDVKSMRSGDDRPPLPDTSSTDKKKKVKNNKKKSEVPEYIKVPESMFGLSEKPVCTFNGHQDDVLDLSWSRSQLLLLSSSMDKTVRLWDIKTKNCLKQFAHSDYVTCIQFNPSDDDYFISGSLDKKVRIWSVPSRKVVDWSDLHDMITAVCYYPDGQGAIVGLHKGTCKTYTTADCKLQQKDQIELHSKANADPKKITSFQFSPSNPSEVVVTSADSRVRIINGLHVVEKLIGYKNTSSQFSAQFSADGKYVICASEDSQVYIWKPEKQKNSGGAKPKYVRTTSYEHFLCTEVTVAVPWHGSNKLQGLDNEPQSKVVAKNSSQLPPVPKKATEKEDSEQTSNTDTIVGEPDDGLSQSDSGAAAAAAINSIIQSTAWGMVIVTAGLGGEIRVYQNVGLPVKLGNLF